MSEKHVLIIGGGLAGLASGVYARLNGFRTTIVEHNLALGGVCAAWQRGPYTIDGCIQWLTGGPFAQVYTELGILPAVSLRPLKHFVTYRNQQDGTSIELTSDLDYLAEQLAAIAPEDRAEIDQLLSAARRLPDIDPGIQTAEELLTVRDRLSMLWDMRDELGDLMHFRRPTAEWCEQCLKSARVRRFFGRLFPGQAPGVFLAFFLGYLARGWLSRPIGGTARFRDALVERYHELGGAEVLNSTVDEVLVVADRATGVRLADGSMLHGDIVISTASAPETVLRLLGGRYDANATRSRLESWKLFDPVVLVSYGVEREYAGHPSTLLMDGLEPVAPGMLDEDHLVLRIYNDEPSVAPAGHTVVQVTAESSYDYWATRGTRYGAEKDALAEALLGRLEKELPGVGDAVRMRDVVTPLTFWRSARSWRGAYEGWMPSREAFFRHIDKTLRGLDGFFMAGQWLEPGGGVPNAVASGRKVVQLICHGEGRSFVPART